MTECGEAIVLDSLGDFWWVLVLIVCAGYCCWYAGRFWR